MGINIKDRSVFVAAETVEGTAKVPVAGDFIASLPIEINGKKASVDIDELGVSAVSRSPSRLGGFDSVEGTVTLNVRAGETEGALPRSARLFETHGFKFKEIAEIALSGTQTKTLLKFATGSKTEMSKYAVGDVVVLEKADGSERHISSIKAINKTDVSITLDIEATFAPAAGDKILKIQLGVVDSSVVKSATVGEILKGEGSKKISRYMTSAKASAIELSQFEKNNVPQWAFTLAGVSDIQSVGDFSDGAEADKTLEQVDPVIVKNACIYIDGEKVGLKTMGFTSTREQGTIQTTCSGDALTGIRQSDLTVEGTFTVSEKSDADVKMYNAFNAGTNKSLLAYMGNPKNEKALENMVIVFFPSIQLAEYSTAAGDIVMEEEISFKANSGKDQSKNQVLVAFV